MRGGVEGHPFIYLSMHSARCEHVYRYTEAHMRTDAQCGCSAMHDASAVRVQCECSASAMRVQCECSARVHTHAHTHRHKTDTYTQRPLRHTLWLKAQVCVPSQRKAARYRETNTYNRSQSQSRSVIVVVPFVEIATDRHSTSDIASNSNLKHLTHVLNFTQ